MLCHWAHCLRWVWCIRRVECLLWFWLFQVAGLSTNKYTSINSIRAFQAKKKNNSPILNHSRLDASSPWIALASKCLILIGFLVSEPTRKSNIQISFKWFPFPFYFRKIKIHRFFLMVSLPQSWRIYCGWRSEQSESLADDLQAKRRPIKVNLFHHKQQISGNLFHLCHGIVYDFYRLSIHHQIVSNWFISVYIWRKYDGVEMVAGFFAFFAFLACLLLLLVCSFRIA